MKENFDLALGYVLGHEGGYSNHPRDNGGATQWGITHGVYDAWRKSKGLPKRDVRNLTREEMIEIYRDNYWHAVKGDDLPAGLDYAIFDFAVNSGPARAAKFIQKLVGVNQDGVIGAKTLTAIYQKNAKDLIEDLCDARLAYLQRLDDWDVFGRGWYRRVTETEERALKMVSDKPTKPVERSRTTPRRNLLEELKKRFFG